MAESASAIGPIPSATAELPPTRLRPSGTIVLYALVERSTGAAAWATRLRSATSVQALHLGHRRFGPSRRRVEARALRTALEEALAAGWRTVTVLVSDRRGARWLEGALSGAGATADRDQGRLGILRGLFDSVEVRVVEDLDDPALVHTVKQALEQTLRGASRRRTDRVRAIERTIERARSVELARTPRGFLAQGRYRVSLEPPSCECPAWTRRWAHVPLSGRRAGRLPCKHLVAAALAEGTVTPRDLEQLVRRAVR